VIHFFQPFATDGGAQQNQYPSVDRINKVIESGYVPMITLEDHFVNVKPGMQQPNLYSIVEGHFDSFFKAWANQIRQVKGVVLLRILHEFNGDWYPWCLANNDKDPKLLIKAFRHIHDMFTQSNVTNVKFIWCPNSMSWPQESWNFIMDAYPGDEYVDYVGLDIYNGAGKDPTVWRSFRKEGMENYFVLTQRLPNKTLFVCETASREREAGESASAQNKAEWIRQMSEALGTDMSGVRLLAWFNEKKTFHVTSSEGAQGAFLDYVLKNDHFKSGTSYLKPLLDKQ
jgi:beta-mannanase